MNASYRNAQCNLRTKPLAASVVLAFGFGVMTLGEVSASTLTTVHRTLAAAASGSLAAAQVVATCADSGAGSLREALASAQSGDTVDLRSLACDRISLAGGELTVAANDLTLQGPGATKLTIPSVHHTGVGTLRVESLRIADGVRCIVSKGTVSLVESIVTACSAGGVRSDTGLIMRNSTVSNNGYTGVGVYAGDTTITGSTISGNIGGYCGALFTSGEGTVRIENTTISGNTGAWSACIHASSVSIANSTIAFTSSIPNIMTGETSVGLAINSPQLKLESTILAKNPTGDLNVSASTAISGHNNLIMLGATAFETGAEVLLPADTLKADPLLQPLGDNGGPTLTHALAAGSPAIDTGANASHLEYDQRGAPRVAGAATDIGALEVQPGTAAVPFIGPGFTGNWFDAGQSGHGFALEVLPGNVMLLQWFVFAPQGGQAWIVGTGPIIGNQALIQGYQKIGSGGLFPPAFDAELLQNQYWGAITVTFADCNSGTASWAPVVSGYTAGSIPLQRLTLPAGLTCP